MAQLHPVRYAFKNTKPNVCDSNHKDKGKNSTIIRYIEFIGVNKEFGLISTDKDTAHDVNMFRSFMNNINVRTLAVFHESMDKIFDTYTTSHSQLIQFRINISDVAEMNYLDLAKMYLLQYDFVLPLQKSVPIQHSDNDTQSAIWSFLLQKAKTQKIRQLIHDITNLDIYEDEQREEMRKQLKQIQDVNDWIQGREHGIISSDDISKVVGEDEWAILRKYNELDIQLFQFSQNIAKMDLLFFQFVQQRHSHLLTSLRERESILLDRILNPSHYHLTWNQSSIDEALAQEAQVKRQGKRVDWKQLEKNEFGAHKHPDNYSNEVDIAQFQKQYPFEYSLF
ncbi:hypothetical protein RFI_11595, partial [Reticulomyxa filosa]